MASKNTELKLEQEAKKKAEVQAFIDDLKEVENKHSMRIVALMDYTSQGLMATLGHQRFDKVELKADEKMV